jgi:AmiR/NasT family two-component response regulator
MDGPEKVPDELTLKEAMKWLAEARRDVENLETAMESRSVIDQAIGILMAPGGRWPDEAFALLVGVSQRHNRKLREVATELVEATAARGRDHPHPS